MRKITIRDDRRRIHFGEILDEWCNVIEKYTNEFSPDDALYWYNERATLSTLSVSAGRKDFHVLEEYRADKKGNKSGEIYKGRTDLYLAKGHTEYVLEAKQIWVSISGRESNNTNKKIISSLTKARVDAAASNINKLPVFGVVFAIPYIPKTYIKNSEALIKNFTSSLNNIDYDAMAYVFPKKSKAINDRGEFYPGVVCVIRAPRRRSTR